jgi:DNA-binding protein HU-beta
VVKETHQLPQKRGIIMPVMNKAELIEAVASRSNVSKDDARKIIDNLKDVVIDEVSSGTEVKIPGFAAFTPYTSPARVMKHPRTGEDTEVPERKSVKVRVMGTFKKTVA